MGGIAGGKALLGETLRTNTLNDLPTLASRFGEIDHMCALRFAGEGAAIEDDDLLGIFLPCGSGSLKQRVDNEVVLCSGIFDLVGSEEGVTGRVLAQDDGVENFRERLRDMGLPGTRQARHDDEHEFIMTTSLRATTVCEPEPQRAQRCTKEFEDRLSDSAAEITGGVALQALCRPQ